MLRNASDKKMATYICTYISILLKKIYMVFKFLLNFFPTSLYSTHNMLSKSKYSPHGLEEKLIRLLLEISKVSKASSSTAQSSQSLSLGLFANSSRIFFLMNNPRTFSA